MYIYICSDSSNLFKSKQASEYGGFFLGTLPQNTKKTSIVTKNRSGIIFFLLFCLLG